MSDKLARLAQARLALARAVYSHAEILLLDDILSALDVHTSRWIVDKCLRGDLVRGRTVLLVVSEIIRVAFLPGTINSLRQTHNLGMTAPLAELVVSISSNGRVASQRGVSEALSKDPLLAADAEEVENIMEKEAQVIDGGDTTPERQAKPAGQLIHKEEVSEGRIDWNHCELERATISTVRAALIALWT